MRPSKTLILFISIFFTSFSFAQSDSLYTGLEFEKLIARGKMAGENKEYAQALEYYTKADALANKIKSKENIFLLKKNIGNIYGFLSNFGEALGYYQQALDIAKELDSNEKVAIILNNIGWLYAEEKDYKSAIYNFKNAYQISSKYEVAGYVKSKIAVNISSVYNSLGEYTMAQQYLQEVENLHTTEEIKQMWKINYAESLLLEGEVEVAEEITKGLLDEAHINCYTCIMELLSKIYKNQNKNDLAIYYAHKGLDYSPVLIDKIDLYNNLSKLYFSEREYSLAFKYRDSVIVAKDSMHAHINRGLYEANKVKMKVQEYQNEIKINKERSSTQRKFFIVILIFSLVVFFFIYRTLRGTIVKQKQKQIISEKQEKITQLELNNLKNKVAEKNRKLSAKALYLSGRNKLIEEIINSITKVPQLSQNPNIIRHMRELKVYLKTDTEWDDFISYFNQVNPGFIKKLKLQFPKLTSQDIRFICYIYMNLDLKEISTVLNITSEATKKRKQRIAKKMNLETDALHNYIINFD